MARGSLPVSHHRKARRLVPKLLDWYRTHARDLPWRHTEDPYAIWISEIMLQQTQVTTVMPYWKRWMRALPTVQKLARINPERVLKLWEGLGYYSRARNLQAAAQKIVTEHGGIFPEDPKIMRELPGIGRYTAGAISSIAFDQPEPIVDGNVVRILTRIFGIRENPKNKKTREELWSLAQTLVSTSENCGALNQSLMELGATVCHPRQPECENCPVIRNCVARREKTITLIPAKGKRIKYTEKEIKVFVIKRNGRLLMQKRPKGVINADFWELPNNETRPEITLPKRARLLASAKHNITSYRIKLNAYSMESGQFKGRWFTFSDLRKFPVTAAHRKILKIVEPTLKRTIG